MWYVGVFCRGDWTDVGELCGEAAGESEGEEDWTDELVSVCKRVLVLDWTQCLSQGAHAPPTMLRGRMTGFPKQLGARASGETG